MDYREGTGADRVHVTAEDYTGSDCTKRKFYAAAAGNGGNGVGVNYGHVVVVRHLPCFVD